MPDPVSSPNGSYHFLNNAVGLPNGSYDFREDALGSPNGSYDPVDVETGSHYKMNADPSPWAGFIENPQRIRVP